MDFRERLFDLRRQAGLSQEELANLVGVTRQAVQKWEAGTSRPDMDNLVSLAEYFQVSLDYLVTGKEPSPPPAPTIVNNYYHEHRWHYEYKSKRTLFGLPLVHINCGPDVHWARGVIAIGNIATGFVALGGIAAGLLSLGAVSLGLLLALGALSVGIIAIGGVALGWFAWGGIVCGIYSVGGIALASKIAVGGVASAPLAFGDEVQGAQAWHVPSGGLPADQLPAACAAIEANAPRWVANILEFFVRHW